MNNMITPRELGISDAIPRPKRTDWRIGVVGYGGISGAHVPAYLEAGWQIVAVADPDPRARERANQAMPGARLYENYQDLVSDGNVEVVSLLTQPTLRVPVVEAAFRNGKSVLTEKPFANTIEGRFIDHQAETSLSRQDGPAQRWKHSDRRSPADQQRAGPTIRHHFCW